MREETVRGMGTGDLVRRLFGNFTSMVEREATLARAEAESNIRQTLVSAGVLGLGLLMLYTALAALIAAIVLAIAPALTAVEAALVLVVVFAVIGAIVAWIGYSRVKVRPLELTRETMREDVEWARDRTRSQGR